MPEATARWSWDFRSSPEVVWSWISDTARFNRLVGLDPVEILPRRDGDPAGLRRLRQRQIGGWVDYTERAYEWERLRHFSVSRHFESGLLRALHVRSNLEAVGPGTRMHYQLRLETRGFWGALIYRIGLRWVGAKIEKKLREADARSATSSVPVSLGATVRWASEGETRLVALLEEWKKAGASPAVVERFRNWVSAADEVDVGSIRPYVLADLWAFSRKEVLESLLLATRTGLLELRWTIVCPSCRNSTQAHVRLVEHEPHADCESCQTDFDVDLDRLVEVTFRVHPSVRPTDVAEFCTGGPGRTPHILAQKWLAPGEALEVTASEAGDYRARLLGEQGAAASRAVAAGEKISVCNEGSEEAVALVERTRWTEQAATARELLALAKFREFFSAESVRQGAVFPVGQEVIVFTDLKGSTRLYRDVGDAVAFAKVYRHFGILKDAVEREDGALVKTIGDAVMAVFHSPVQALRAFVAAHRAIHAMDDSSIVLKVGAHKGPCLVVDLNGRPDYFGTTVNLASRLEGLSTGGDVVLTREFLEDADVRSWLAAEGARYAQEEIEAKLKGFEDRPEKLVRLRLL
jgi:class 3 adenylate cyclase